jgi:hypothetical protein
MRNVLWACDRSRVEHLAQSFSADGRMIVRRKDGRYGRKR